MATLLQFRRPKRDGREAQTKSRPKRGQSAEIVIFPGVRIERHDSCPYDRGQSWPVKHLDPTEETA